MNLLLFNVIGNYICCIAAAADGTAVVNDDDDDDDSHYVMSICRKEVPAREQSTKMEVKGLFIGARVVRGVDWHLGDQDGNDIIVINHNFSKNEGIAN